MKNSKVISAEDFLRVLAKARKGRTLRVFANELGIAYQFLSGVLRGIYHPGPTIAKKLGYEQVYGFRKIARSKSKAAAPRKRKQMHLTEDARLGATIKI